VNIAAHEFVQIFAIKNENVCKLFFDCSNDLNAKSSDHWTLENAPVLAMGNKPVLKHD